MTPDHPNSSGPGSSRSMAGSQQDRNGQAQQTRGFVSASSAAIVVGLSHGRSFSVASNTPAARRVGFRGSARPQLFIAAIFDHRISKIRPALLDQAPQIDAVTGDSVHLAMLGHPGGSFVKGRALLERSGHTLDSLREGWDEAAKDRGEIDTVLAFETHQLLEYFKLDRSQVPCLVFQFVVGTADAKVVVPIPAVVDASELKARQAADAIALALKDAGAGWVAPESRAKGPGFARDVVDAIVKRLTGKLRGIAGQPEPEPTGYVPTELELEILRCLKTAGSRFVTRQIALKVEREEGSIGEELANLRRRGLIDNERKGRRGEVGYGLTESGRATLSIH